MKISALLFLTIFHCFMFSQNVVINELYYDPPGSDGGYEWIELYNAGSVSVNMSGWRIQKAGAEFENTYIFDYLAPLIPPGGYLLIGESHVSGVDIITDLGFQNGGTATDGVRLVSADGLYTDTILYDEPNSNNLPDDISDPGENFAPDILNGNSLARVQDGEDSNNSEIDWFECGNPTPGEPNIYPIDLSLDEMIISENNGVYQLITYISNLSTSDVDNSSCSIEITINDSISGSYELPAINSNETIEFSVELGTFTEALYVAGAELNFIYDLNLDNNILMISFLVGDSPIIINEIMFKPSSGNSEWIEIFNRSTSGYYVDNFKIYDSGAGEISFSGNIESLDFLIICQDENSLFDQYPNVDQEKVVQAYSWTSLNNTDESICLKDAFATVLDSTSYSGSDQEYNISLERVDPFHDEIINWLICQDSLGATPDLPNSVLPLEKDLESTASGFEIQENGLLHSVMVENVGLENIDSATLYCYSSLNENDAEIEIFSEEISLSDTLYFDFTTDIPGIGYTTFHYLIESDEDMNLENNSDYSFYNNNFLPFVINEIMYDPDNNEPEWIELKINSFIPNLKNIIAYIGVDSIKIDFQDGEYVLLTGSEEDADSLRELYDLDGAPVFTGIASLSNSGENISLVDFSKNTIESFFYEPDWNDGMMGVSIERVNPELQAASSNFGPSVNTATPGKENSIYVQLLPENIDLSINPNPFSPFNSERTIISFELPEILSEVTIRIFDLKGRLVRKFVDQTLLANKGDLIWDGEDDRGKRLPIGVYITLMEATSRESEKTYSKTKTVVIGK
ncbi:MAG: lamin tail domain-containing protein [Candidatus Cloacimonetes bacterium]|nr:lamin tail domain-containing protein [Candidatus Cloacimonadota bacterium]